METLALATARDSLESRAVESCLTSLAPASRRVYAARIRDYLAWSKGKIWKTKTNKPSKLNQLITATIADSDANRNQNPNRVPTIALDAEETPIRALNADIVRASVVADADAPLDREHVQRYMRSLELAAASPQVRNQALAALKKLATEAAELGWIDHTAAAQIGRIKARRITGIRSGKWLTRDQAQRLLAVPDCTTVAGRRDSVVLALLLGCGLRRDEAVRLTTAQCVTMDERMVLRNVEGKGGRIRSVSVPRWAAQRINEWLKEPTQ